MPANYVLTRNLMFLIVAVALTYVFGLRPQNILNEREASSQTRIKQATYTDCDDPNAEPVEDGAYCACVTGYAGSPCKDIDECRTEEEPCKHYGTCINREGGYTCECFHGFKQAADNKDCEDVNECESAIPCGVGICRNSVGSYACECRPGYEFRGGTCADINECEEEKDKACNGFGSCKNTISSYYCECWPGFKANSDLTLCEDINECHVYHPPIFLLGNCVNIFGTRACKSDTGYENMRIAPADRSADDISMATNIKLATRKLREKVAYCVDIDECKSHRCGPGTCENLIGKYKCDCYPGYQEVMVPNPEDPTARVPKCVDINECGDRNYLNKCCDEYGDCVNTEGSYICIRLPGLRRFVDQYKCDDIDECASDPCGPGTCENLIGKYKCDCYPGYQEVMVPDPKDSTARVPKCVDINECYDYHPPKFLLGNCVNIFGTRACNSDTGYENRRIAPADRSADVISMATNIKLATRKLREKVAYCIDRNECNEPKFLNQCAGDNVYCVNTEGSYNCKCLPGFHHSVDQYRCDDIDECASDPCGPGTCENLIGRYKCNCYPGYQEVMVRDPEDPTARVPKCVDVDECTVYRDYACKYSVGLQCINTKGSYHCECKAGYADRCKVPIHRVVLSVLFGANCKENVHPWESKPYPRCMDIDECSGREAFKCFNHGHNYCKCMNAPGTFWCCEQDGWSCFWHGNTQGYCPADQRREPPKKFGW